MKCVGIEFEYEMSERGSGKSLVHVAQVRWGHFFVTNKLQILIFGMYLIFTNWYFFRLSCDQFLKFNLYRLFYKLVEIWEIPWDFSAWKYTIKNLSSRKYNFSLIFLQLSFFVIIRLPLDTDDGEEVVAEGTSSNKKEAVLVCATEACRLIQAYDSMRNKTRGVFILTMFLT